MEDRPPARHDGTANHEPQDIQRRDPAGPQSGEHESSKHPFAEIQRSFLQDIDAIDFAANVVVSGAVDLVRQRLQDFATAIRLPDDSAGRDAPEARRDAIRRIHDAILRHRFLPYLRVPHLLGESLFLSLFATYDAYTGSFLAALFRKRPELLLGIDRSFPVAELLRHHSIEDIKDVVISAEVDSFRRQSYVDQLKSLEKSFAIPLRKFANWPRFVECSQRRNLMTHADGVVSTQYLSVCEAEGYAVPKDLVIGSRLKLDKEYIATACDLVAEVGLKLGHVLWRKSLRSEAATADEVLHQQLFGFLEREQWSRAITFGEFFLNLPRISSQRIRNLAVVNYAIALRAANRAADAVTLLDSIDWSAAAPDFRLADAVLRDDVPQATLWMRRIGKQGEYVTEEGYRTWPLFRTFRSTAEFQRAFEDIYGRQFSEELADEAADAEAKSQALVQELEKMPHDSAVVQSERQETDGV
jgi:hypothetical protein